MRILQVHCTYQFRGGEDTVVAAERELLQQQGLTVETLNFSNEGGVAVKLVMAPFNVAAYRATKKMIRLFRPDIIHIHNLHFAGSAAVIHAVKNSDVPFVQTIHNYRLICPSGMLYHDGEIFLRSVSQRFPWSAIARGVYKQSKLLTAWFGLINLFHDWVGTWRHASRYIVLTQHAQQVFESSTRRFGNGQFIVKPNFSAAPPRRATKSSTQFVFLGRLSEEKGIRVLLEAFSELPYHLTIAGDGPLKDAVIASCARNSNIRYVGVLESGKVHDFLSSARALIFPSAWYEGMPMVIIEALANAVPVIASGFGAMSEMITDGHNGFHFTPGNAASLEAAIERFVNLSPQAQHTLATNAFQTYTEQYTAEKNAELLLGIYRNVISNHELQYSHGPAKNAFALQK